MRCVLEFKEVDKDMSRRICALRSLKVFSSIHTCLPSMCLDGFLSFQFFIRNRVLKETLKVRDHSTFWLFG